MHLPLLCKLETMAELPEADRALLARVAEDVRSFKPRRDIVRQGEAPGHVHLMVEGWACRYQLLPDGGRMITALLMPGDFCDAHITLLGAMDHSIGALGPAKVAFLAHDLMDEMLERPAIARALWWASLVDEAVLRAWIVNIGRRDARARIGHLICELDARLHNVGLGGRDEFWLPLTQEDIADAVGLTPVHVNRMLQSLRDAGMLQIDSHHVAFTDIGRLKEESGFTTGYLHLRERRRQRGTA